MYHHHHHHHIRILLQLPWYCFFNCWHFKRFFFYLKYCGFSQNVDFSANFGRSAGEPICHLAAVRRAYCHRGKCRNKAITYFDGPSVKNIYFIYLLYDKENWELTKQRWEFIKENKKVRKQEKKEKITRPRKWPSKKEKKKTVKKTRKYDRDRFLGRVLFYLVAFLVEVFFPFFLVFLLSCFLL